MKKQYRIKKNEEFSRIIKAHHVKKSKCFTIYYLTRSFDYDRVGLSVGKKIGNAVYRNKVKRQVRMMIQSTFNFNSGYDFVIVVKPPYLENDFATNTKDLSALYHSVYND